MSRLVTAVDLALAVGIDPKRFRGALRAAKFPWHHHNMPWEVLEGSDQHFQMIAVLRSLTGARYAPAGTTRRPRRSEQGKRAGSDEYYFIDLCDRVLGSKASRGHRFTFLTGDADQNGTKRSLPVDVFYSVHNLVIEYCKRQHTESVSFFDRKTTVSGISRREQRRLYDQRRRDVLPSHGLSLIEFHYSDFGHTPSKRLRREEADAGII